MHLQLCIFLGSCHPLVDQLWIIDNYSREETGIIGGWSSVISKAPSNISRSVTADKMSTTMQKFSGGSREFSLGPGGSA